ncbi:MAG TPA: M20/M25/M40 family metallo-hydrolase, partial [Candidatus Elarobacter sp.]|nr:M20/M25/M40 family metallo-hydrolase [Candidatus Elarobacter sp.]
MTIAVPADVVDEVIATRRDLHAHPELGFEEHRTSALVAERLNALGYEVHTGIGQTGVVGVVRGTRPGKTIMLRADMDALPIDEENAVPYRSKTPVHMHACGHDGHVAILLGA